MAQWLLARVICQAASSWVLPAFAQEAATGRTLGAQVTRGAVHAAFLSLLWRLSALHDVEHPDGRDVEALAAARSTFTGQLEAILHSTELVLIVTLALIQPLVHKPVFPAHS